MDKSHLLQHIEKVICNSFDDDVGLTERRIDERPFLFLQLPLEIRLAVYDACAQITLRHLRNVNLPIRRESETAYFSISIFTMNWEPDYYLPYGCGHVKMTRHGSRWRDRKAFWEEATFNLAELRPVDLDALSKIQHLIIFTSEESLPWKIWSGPTHCCQLLPQLRSLAWVEVNQGRAPTNLLSMYKDNSGQLQVCARAKEDAGFCTFLAVDRFGQADRIDVAMHAGMDIHLMNCDEREIDNLKASAEPVSRLSPNLRDIWLTYANGESRFGALEDKTGGRSMTDTDVPVAVQERRARLRAKLYPQIDDSFEQELDGFLALVAKHSAEPPDRFFEQFQTPTSQQVIDMLMKGESYCEAGRYGLRRR